MPCKGDRVETGLCGGILQQGSSLAKLGRYEEAIKCFEKAIELKPDFAEAYYNKGASLGMLKRLDEALKCFEKAIELKPDFARAHYSKGISLKTQGKHKKAEECFEQAKKSAKTNTSNYVDTPNS